MRIELLSYLFAAFTAAMSVVTHNVIKVRQEIKIAYEQSQKVIFQKEAEAYKTEAKLLRYNNQMLGIQTDHYEAKAKELASRKPEIVKIPVYRDTCQRVPRIIAPYYSVGDKLYIPTDMGVIETPLLHIIHVR